MVAGAPPGAPEAYARKVLVNRHRSLLRRLRLEARHAGRDRAEPLDLGPREELLVVGAIRRLPARQRTVLVLRYHEDLPEQEVARLLRIPVGTVKSLEQPGLDPPAPGPGTAASRPRGQPEDAP